MFSAHKSSEQTALECIAEFRDVAEDLSKSDCQKTQRVAHALAKWAKNGASEPLQIVAGVKTGPGISTVEMQLKRADRDQHFSQLSKAYRLSPKTISEELNRFWSNEWKRCHHASTCPREYRATKREHYFCILKGWPGKLPQPDKTLITSRRISQILGN